MAVVKTKVYKNGQIKVLFNEITWEQSKKEIESYKQRREQKKPPVEIKVKYYKDDSNALRVISYYGGKWKFRNIFYEIFKYCKKNLDCNVFADAFTGSGILSLMASKAEYSEIYMNDSLDLVVNYHECMRDYQKFHLFMTYLPGHDGYIYGDRKKYNALSKQIREKEKKNIPVSSSDYNELKLEKVKVLTESKKRYEALAGEVAEYISNGHKYRGHVNVARAVYYYLYRHYTFLGHSSFSPSQKPASYNMLDLNYIRRYYKNVTEVTNLYYKKFSSKFLQNENALLVLDPPYMTETRSDKKAYQKWEFTEKQQRYLLEYISQPGIKAKIILCGYSTSFYDRRLLKYNREKGCHWQKVHILQAGSVSRGAREYLWVNFDFSVLEKQFPEFFKIVPESDWEIKYRKKG